MKYLKTLILPLVMINFLKAAQANPTLQAMQSELTRSLNNLVMEGQEKPYFISYRVTDLTTLSIQASRGSLTESEEYRSRDVSVELRIGDYNLDNSGVQGPRYVTVSNWDEQTDERRFSDMSVPVDDDTVVLKHELWLATDFQYKKAVENLTTKKKELALKPGDDEEEIADFSREHPQVFISDEVVVSVDQEAWEERVKRYSAMFTDYEDITISNVKYGVIANNVYFVNSEGSVVQEGRIIHSIEIEAHTRCEDGMPLVDYACFKSHDGTFDENVIAGAITDMAEGLLSFRQAEECESYVGPVLIAAPVSGAFIENTLAPMLEANRESWEQDEGLKNKVGERILLRSISVYDDPTIDSYKGQTLAGNYLFDDEGVAARRVDLITDGVLRNFLMSRSPVKGFENSNGHGRDGVGIGNLIVESSSPQSFTQLKTRLISECRNQGKPYGLLVTSCVPGEKTGGRRVIVSGGIIINMAGGSNLVEPVAVYKVYADGRQELLRGVKVLSSSPLATLGKIIAAGSDHRVWYTSYPSGSIVAPSLLLSELEIGKSTGGEQTLPILPAPGKE